MVKRGFAGLAWLLVGWMVGNVLALAGWLPASLAPLIGVFAGTLVAIGSQAPRSLATDLTKRDIGRRSTHAIPTDIRTMVNR